jgi:hypothetical protein
MSKLSGALVALLLLVSTAQARVHTVVSFQILQPAGAGPYDDFNASAVAIDGDFLIVIADRNGARQAILFRRGSDGQWTHDRVLVQSTAPAAQLRASVVMKNWIAAIDIDGVTTIWERSGNVWTQARTDGVIRQPGGHAISRQSILIGASGCSEDGVVYEKATDGVWRVTGRLPARSGLCGNQERDVDLNYDYALINTAGSVKAWARNGTNLQWRSAGEFALQGLSAGRGGALALQNSVAVAPGSTVYRRTGSASWAPAGRLIPIDAALGYGDAQQVWYRDSMVLTVEAEADPDILARPKVYVLGANGQFEHVAELHPVPGDIFDLDVSGSTVVALGEYALSSMTRINIYEIPTPRVPPDAIANDFNAGDVGGFETSAGSAYAIAGSQYDHLYRQSNAAVDTLALLTASNWSRYQEVRLDLRPTALNGAGAAAGVALRYVDENNYLALLVTANSARVESRRNGVTVVLNEVALPPLDGWRHVSVTTGDEFIGAFVDGEEVLWTWDRAAMPERGRVALLTRHARADFDNLRATPTEGRNLLAKRYEYFRFEDFSPPIDKVSGTWLEPAARDTTSGLRSSNTSTVAIALSRGPAVDDVAVFASAQLDTWGSTSPVPWFGLVARYQDARNYYYLAIRGSNYVQLRKVVNGVTTVLDDARYTAPVGQPRNYQLRVDGNQLHAFVNGQRVLWAVDSDLAEGRYGIGSYRTAARFWTITANQ